MRILGLDPGTAITGWGILTYQSPNIFSDISYSTITTASTQTLPNRLHEIFTDVTSLIKQTNPDVIAVEKLFFNTNAKTAMSVGQARGVLLVAAVESHIPIFEYTPLQVKQTITGYGRADKTQIQKLVQTLLKLPSIPKPDDAADALGIAITHAFHSKSITFDQES